MARRIGSTLLFGVLVLAGLLWWLRSSPPAAESRAEIEVKADTRPGHVSRERNAPSGSPRPIARAYRMSPAERAEIHRSLLEMLARRAAAASSGTSDRLDDLAGRELDDREEAVADEEMNQWNEVLMQHLGDELEPLTDECFDMALERSPNLVQDVELELTVLADEEFGGLVEVVELGPRNEADDPGFIECLRESVLSVALPAPPFSGRRPIFMSKRFGGD
jgi:hypothetical protein